MKSSWLALRYHGWNITYLTHCFFNNESSQSISTIQSSFTYLAWWCFQSLVPKRRRLVMVWALQTGSMQVMQALCHHLSFFFLSFFRSFFFLFFPFLFWFANWSCKSCKHCVTIFLSSLKGSFSRWPRSRYSGCAHFKTVHCESCMCVVSAWFF